MATKKGHLAAIIAMRLDWTAQDRLLADQLASMRHQLERERARAAKAPATVASAAGTPKPNPLFGVIDRLARQEAQLTKRLRLGATRTAGGQYTAATAPAEIRAHLWARYGKDCQANLMPGLWRYVVRAAGAEIPDDSIGWPDNPSALPMPTGAAQS